MAAGPAFPPVQPRLRPRVAGATVADTLRHDASRVHPARTSGIVLQTLRNYCGRRGRAGSLRGERLILPMTDGSGDRLAALLQRPRNGARRSVVLIHGLSGSEDSPTCGRAPPRCSSRPSGVRLNLRGAGPRGRSAAFSITPGAPTICATRWPPRSGARRRRPLRWSATRSAATCCSSFSASSGRGVADPRRGVGVGADRPRRRGAAHPGAAQRRLPLLPAARDEDRGDVAPAAELAPSRAHAIDAARTIVEFDDRFVAPRNGYRRRRRLLREQFAAAVSRRRSTCRR